jgi:hypothetical protein
MRLLPVDFKHPEPCTREQRLENAFIDLSNAVDSKGLRIFIHTGGFSSGAIRQSLFDFTRRLNRNDRVFVNLDGSEDLNGELVFAVNLQLLINAYVAALEMEYEAAQR